MVLPVIDFPMGFMGLIRTGGPDQAAWEAAQVRLDLMGLVIRTDSSDQAAWEEAQVRLRTGLAELASDFPNNDGVGELGLLFVDGRTYTGLTPDQASSLVDEANDDMHKVIFLADSATMSSQDRTLLAVSSQAEALENWGDEEGHGKWKFRLRPESVARVHLGLSPGGTSFSEHFEDVDENGVYRY